MAALRLGLGTIARRHAGLPRGHRRGGATDLDLAPLTLADAVLPGCRHAVAPFLEE